jgi:DNA primase
MVSPELQMYKCFGCGEAGDVYSFLQKYEGMEFGEALRFLAERVGVKLVSFRPGEQGEKERLYQINSWVARFYHYLLLTHPVAKRALNYLQEDRGLKPETIETFQLGFAPDVPDVLKKFLVDKKKANPKDLERLGLGYFRNGRFLDKFAGRIIFPLFDHRGNLAGFAGRVLPGTRDDIAKYINSPETPVYHKSNLLFGLNLTKQAIKKAEEAVVVEGELDAISSWQVGVANVVAIKGTALTEEQARLISRFTRRLILALDTDLAGDAAARRGVVIAQLQGLDLRVARFGEYKDPDEAARANAESYQKFLQNAVGVWDFIVDSVFAKADVTSGEGKARISREIVPILSSIPDKIVQAHYIEMVAAKLRVPTAAVSEQVETVEAQKEGVKVEEIGLPKEEKSRRQLLEERLLTLAFQSDPQALGDEKVIRLVATPLAKRIVEEYLKFHQEGKTFSPSEFAEGLPKELVEGFAEMVLRDIASLVEDKNQLASELELVLAELEKEDISQRQERLGVKIRELEQSGAKEELEKTIKKYDTLSLRKKQLEEGGKRGIILSEA